VVPYQPRPRSGNPRGPRRAAHGRDAPCAQEGPLLLALGLASGLVTSWFAALAIHAFLFGVGRVTELQSSVCALLAFSGLIRGYYSRPARRLDQSYASTSDGVGKASAWVPLGSCVEIGGPLYAKAGPPAWRGQRTINSARGREDNWRPSAPCRPIHKLPTG
jgi:hypothetical protein